MYLHRIYNFHKLFPTTSVGNFVILDNAPAPSPKLKEMVLPDVLCCDFVYGHCRKVLEDIFSPLYE
jgi:hypothetical protein